MKTEKYYNQPYHSKLSTVPLAPVRQSFKDFFFKPFTWNARSTRREFWIGYALYFVLNTFLSLFMLATPFLYGTVDTNNTGWSAPVVRVTIIVGILEFIF